MNEKAIEKLTTEMNANEKNPYVQVIGRYLIEHVEAQPEHAEMLLSEDKTILKSLDVMRRYAETKRVGNVAVLSDDEGYQVVLQYFGCWEGEMLEIPPEPQRPVVNHTPTRVVQPNLPIPTNKYGKQPGAGWEQTSLFDLVKGN